MLEFVSEGFLHETTADSGKSLIFARMGRKVSLLCSNPAVLNQDSLLDYKELTIRYPYCQCARLLFLLNLRQVDDTAAYKSALPVTAINLPDRTRLKEQVDGIRPVAGPEKPRSQTALPSARNETLPRRHAESFSPWSQALPQPHQARPQSVRDTKPAPHQVRVEDVRSILNRPQAKSQADADTLIDRFLHGDPAQTSRIRMDKDFDYDSFDPDTGHSNREDFSFGTETLAGMYLQNGAPKKAIAIYENLGLKFPEKSSYFANLIRRVKKDYHIK